MDVPSWLTKVASIDSVDIWSTHIDQPLAIYRECKLALSTDERLRFEGYGNKELADSFAVRRGSLRLLLSSVTGDDSAMLEIKAHGLGKPRIVGNPLEFSASSSKDLAVFALSPHEPVGVDVEWIDPHFEFDRLLQGILSPQEAERFHDPSPKEFFQMWCRKEACVKALGRGLHLHLQQLEVVQLDEVQIGDSLLKLTSIDSIGASYCAALAVVTKAP